MRSIDQIANNPTRQTGAALLLFTALLVVISASVLLDRLSNRTRLNTGRAQETTAALAEARAALIGWAVSHSQEPGRLPWPDRNGDANYDGSGDCFAGGVSNALLLGRFPFSGDATPCSNEAMGVYPLDGAGEPLFYAVSQNLIQHRGKPGTDPAINPGLLDGGASYPWLTVVDQNGGVISDRVAAVIIAPGAALEAQDRSAAAPDPDQFLDSVAGVESNADNDLVFIQYPDSRFTAVETDSFNDRLTYITIDELMRKVEKRVLGDAAVALRTYRTTNGRFPWLSLYRDPLSATGAQTVTGRVDSVPGGSDKLVDNDVDFNAAGVVDGDIIINVTRRTSWVVKNVNGNNKLDIYGSPDFIIGHAYNVRPAFNGIWGQREGHIPYIYIDPIDPAADESYALATGFTLTWNNGNAAPAPGCAPATLPAWVTISATGCTQLQNSYQTGTYTMPQPTVPTPASDNGECIWTDIGTADCMPNTETRNPAYTMEVCLFGCGFIRVNAPVRRDYVYTLNYAGTGATTSANNVKTRRVTNTAPETIQMTDTLWPGFLDVALWSGTVTMNAGNYVMDGIHFDIEDGVEFPGYFFTNLWHEYLYAKISDEHVAVNDAGAASSDNCTAGTDCVSVEIGGATNRNEIQAVIVGAGGQLAGQDRVTGTPCPGQPDFLCDYFESNNAVTANDSADRGVLAATFNDQVRVIQPNPP